MRQFGGYNIIAGLLVSGAITFHILWKFSRTLSAAFQVVDVSHRNVQHDDYHLIPTVANQSAQEEMQDVDQNESETMMKLMSLEKRLHQMMQDLAQLNQSFYNEKAMLSFNQSHDPPKEQDLHEEQRRQTILPECDEIMQAPHSPYQDGSFLTSFTTPIRWTLRADGSRQLDLNNGICRLKRYTSVEAKTCLASTHMALIGDSLTRYQFLSLAYFLEHGVFPPRFGNFQQPCTHRNETGYEACSPVDQPNICMETDWRFRIPPAYVNDPWVYYYSTLGGGEDGGILNGHLDCSCARSNTMTCGSACGTDNMLYTNGWSHTVLSYISENGWYDKVNPLHGFSFTNCSQLGTCRQSNQQTLQRINRSKAFDFDWSQPFPEAIDKDGVLRKELPKPDIAIYNRGHWGPLTADRAKVIMPILYDWVNNGTAQGGAAGGGGGRCFFRSTTGSYVSLRDQYFVRELRQVRPHVHAAGCSYLDYAYLTETFGALGETKDWRIHGERGSVFWDGVHYMPWVYEELNQVLLNVLCNTKRLL